MLTSIFYYRRVATVVGLVVLTLGAVVSMLVPPSYTSRARLLALDASLYEMQAGNSQPHGGLDIGGAAVNVELQLLASSELHREVVRRELGSATNPIEFDKRLRQFEAHLNVSKLESSNVIEIVYRDGDPKQAAQALRLLLAAYFDERVSVLTSGRVGFLTGERDKAATQLNQANEEIAAYERLNGVVDVTEQINGAITLGDQLQQQMAETETALAESKSTVNILRANAKRVPRQVELFTDNTEAAHTVGTMEASLFQLETKRADLAARYMASSPFVKQIDAQIASLKAAIAAQKNDSTIARRTGYNTYYDTVNDQLVKAEATLAGVTARFNVLQRQIAESGDRLKSLIEISDTLARLRMQRDLISDNVKNFSSQLEQASIQQNQATTTGSTNVRVIEAPVVPGQRSNPRSLMLAASLFASIALAAATVLLLSSLRETFLSPQEAERSLKLPVLCDLPLYEPGGGAARHDFGRLIGFINGWPSETNAKVTLLLSMNTQDDLNLAANGLAAALVARAPGTVALVRLTEAPAKPGGRADVPANGPAGNAADVRGEGPASGEATPPHVPLQWENGVVVATATLGGVHGQFDRLLAGLRSNFEYVILVAPPVASSFASVELAPLADMVFLLVKAEDTRKPVAEAVLTRVSYTGAEVSGLVMTGRRFPIPAWVYHLVLNEGFAA